MMAFGTTITRYLTSLIGNLFAWLSDNVFAWLWLSALLIVVAIYMISAPIRVAGEGGRSAYEIAATLGGILSVSAGAGWALHKLGEQRQRGAKRVAGFLAVVVLGRAGHLEPAARRFDIGRHHTERPQAGGFVCRRFFRFSRFPP